MSAIKLQQLFEDFWQWRLKESPEFATQIGVYDYDDQLDSNDVNAFRRRKETCQQFLRQASDVLQNDKDSLTEDETFNLEVFIEELTTYIEGLEFEGYVCPINYIEGVQVDFQRLVGWMIFKTPDDYSKLLSRYRQLPIQINEIIRLLQHGIKMGIVNHEVSMKGVSEQLDALQVSVEKSGFFKPFLQFPEEFPSDLKTKLAQQGKEAIEKEVLPAFRKLQDFLAVEYKKALRLDISCTSLPRGEKYYEQCLKFHLSLNLTPKEVHELGKREVERIEQEMTKIKTILKFSGTLKEFMAHLRNDRQYYCKTKEELLEKFRFIAEKKIQPLIPKIILNPPKMKLQIQAEPGNTPDAPAALYLAGSFDGSRPGSFYVNLAQFASQPTYELMSLSLHEGEPGHHTQASYAIEQPNTPSFRKFLEDRKYSDAPSRFPINTSYIEGWGLYSESLGEDLGLYEDHVTKFGHCSEEIFRACRLVVDTGMHAFGWTRQQAIDYMKDHSAASEKNIENEIDRYITWPGQACAYKIGELKLKELRKKAETNLGKHFDIRQFHEILLKNGGPLTVLEKRVNKFIEHRCAFHAK